MNISTNNTRRKLWVIFVDYNDGNDTEKSTTVVDMQVLDTPTHPEKFIEFALTLEADALKINIPFFITMSMNNPVIRAQAFPRLTTKAGKRQLMEVIQSLSVTTFIDKDFDRLFDQVNGDP